MDQADVQADHSDQADGMPMAVLWALLNAHPDAMVAAIGPDARLVPLPESIPLTGHTAFERASGIDLVVADDQIVIIEGWKRAQREPVVHLEVRLLADPARRTSLHFIDVRRPHGVHAVVLEAHDPALVLASIEAREARRRRVGRVKRDATGTFLEADEGACALLGMTSGQLVGRRTVELVHPEDLDRAVDSWMAMRAGTGGRTQVRFRHADGHHLWLEVSSENHLDDDLGCVVSDLVDISDDMAELEALHDRERLLQRLAEALPVGICHLRADRQVVYSNAPFASLLGPVDSLDALILSVAGTDRPLVEAAVERALDGRESDLEVGVFHGFEERRCDLTLRAMTNDRGGIDGVIICASDVTDRSRLRAELEHRASHDALSGCLNRAATVSALERALREFQAVTVAYIDLDHFKAINDDLGHAAGDELLRVVAARLRSVTRVEDRLGRIGGDEFVVICPQGRAPVEASTLVERLTEAVCGDVVFARQRIPLRASIGAATSRDGELDAEAVLSRADAAMYDAKRRARRSVSGLVAVPRPLSGLD